jgi:hypothetical protein
VEPGVTDQPGEEEEEQNVHQGLLSVEERAKETFKLLIDRAKDDIEASNAAGLQELHDAADENRQIIADTVRMLREAGTKFDDRV